MLFVKGKTRAERLEICNVCPHFVSATKSCGPLVTEAFTDSKLCGCHMPTKAKFKTAKCPLGKWGPTVSTEDVQRIRDFLDVKRPTIEELAEVHSILSGGTEPAACSSCVTRQLKELRNFIRHADTT